MKRMVLCAAIVIAALFILSNSTTNAVNRTFAERFAGDGKADKQSGETGVYNFDKAHSFIGFQSPLPES